jgi:alkaline phosphatase D
VGRTRTAPASGAAVDRLRFAFASCQEYQAGYWSAHTHLAAEDVDLVVFLGDYLYENAPNPGAARPLQTPAPVDLAGYRRRYGEYKADPALQAAHAATPWVCTWDDHEVANNYAGDVPGGTGAEPGEGGFRARRAAAYQAWYEHTPARVEPPDGPDVTVYRSVGWGDLARFFVLDGRQYRSDQACAAASDIGVACAEVGDDERTMLGGEQERWLGRALEDTDAAWNVLAQQTIVSPIAVPLGPVEGLNLDQWDGYPAARRRLVDQLRDVANPVVITGDIHASGVGVVTDDPDDPATPVVVPELVGTSISSTFPPGLVDLFEAAAAAMPSVRYVDARRRGYVVCEVTAEDLTAEFRYVASTAGPDAEVATGARWVVAAGDPEPRRA